MTTPPEHAVSIRPARLEDAEDIATVHATSWRETYGRFVEDADASPWFAVEPRIGMWRTNLIDGGLETVVALADDRVIGFAAAQKTDDDDAVRPEELTMLYVLADAHGRGVGQGLLDAVLSDRPASLWVAADNPRAHAFYRRNGFHPDGARSSFGPMKDTVRLVR